MKQIKAFIHHVRSAIVVEALRDAGYWSAKIHKSMTSLELFVPREELGLTSPAGFMLAP